MSAGRRGITFRIRPAPGRLWQARHQEGDVLSERTSAGEHAPHEAARLSGDDLLRLVLRSLDDDKAEDVVTVELRGKSEIADHMVIASGRSTRQVTAICEKLLDRLKHEGGTLARAEGLEQGDWVLIDAGDVIVHVFRPEVREFYQLEKMWLPAQAAAKRATAYA